MPPLSRSSALQCAMSARAPAQVSSIRGECSAYVCCSVLQCVAVCHNADTHTHRRQAGGACSVHMCVAVAAVCGCVLQSVAV